MSVTYTKKELENSQIEITGVLPYEDLLVHEEKALTRMAKEIEIDGFRKGTVPAAMARQYINDMHLLEAMAEEVLMKEYTHIITNHAPDAIGQPNIQITKIARDNPMEFKMTVTVMPQITLPDYKKIAKEENTKKEKVEVTDEDVQKSLDELRKLRARQDKNKAAGLHTHEDGSVHDENHNEVEVKETPDADLPELNDEFAQSFGADFKTMDDLKSKIRENMQKEKDMMSNDKVRVAIGEKMVESTIVDVPQIMIDGEVERMMYQMEADLANSGMSVDEYVKMINKTKDELKSEWKPSAEKRVKLQLAMDEIAKVENLKPDEEAINKEVEMLKNMYKDIDQNRAKLYVSSQLQNEKVLAFLDAQ